MFSLSIICIVFIQLLKYDLQSISNPQYSCVRFCQICIGSLFIHARVYSTWYFKENVILKNVHINATHASLFQITYHLN